MMKKPKQSQFAPVTESEVALVNAYLEQRRIRLHPQFSQMTQTQHDSDTTECDSEESNSGASSWKESESEHHPSPASIKKRKIAQRQKNVGSYQIKERPCLHCKALRTNEWLTRHFLQNTSVTTPMKGDIQEENSSPDINTKFSKFWVLSSPYLTWSQMKEMNETRKITRILGEEAFMIKSLYYQQKHTWNPRGKCSDNTLSKNRPVNLFMAQLEDQRSASTMVFYSKEHRTYFMPWVCVFCLCL